MLISHGPCYIYEAAFSCEGVLVYVDVIQVNKDGSLNLIEVKSSTSAREPNGKVKAKYGHDVAIQAYVIEKSGYKINSVFLMHVNNQYSFKDELNLEEFFAIEEITNDFKEYTKQIPDRLEEMKKTLQMEQEPKVDNGIHCKNPYVCAFKEYCWKSEPKQSILYISNLSNKKLDELRSQQVQDIKDIPENLEFTTNQSAQIKAVKTGVAQIEASFIREHLKLLKYPLYFVDYETIGYAIPKFENTRAYEQYPFQFSLHIQRVPGGELEHHEFLHDQLSDPRRSFAENLVKKMGSSGSVIVYYEPFEKSKTQAVADCFPDLSAELKAIIDRIWDLHEVFQKRWYVDASFSGSSSIKKVLPILCPGLTYENLNIKDGGTAMKKYGEMIELEPGAARDQIRKDLIEYCKLDTLAMVKILEKLTKDFPPAAASQVKAKDSFLKMKKR